MRQHDTSKHETLIVKKTAEKPTGGGANQAVAIASPSTCAGEQLVPRIGDVRRDKPFYRLAKASDDPTPLNQT